MSAKTPTPDPCESSAGAVATTRLNFTTEPEELQRMIRYSQRDDRQFLDDGPSTPPWPKICAYCDAVIAGPAERLRHVSVNFQPPACQLPPATLQQRGEHEQQRI